MELPLDPGVDRDPARTKDEDQQGRDEERIEGLMGDERWMGKKFPFREGCGRDFIEELKSRKNQRNGRQSRGESHEEEAAANHFDVGAGGGEQKGRFLGVAQFREPHDDELRAPREAHPEEK